ncbi:hypothetical protein CW304_04295 [Bacillus sp. UFRGS-B20]|nr:hypothetical protein CW304_04295 [Bacillus sp. UFRGS-B20]
MAGRPAGSPDGQLTLDRFTHCWTGIPSPVASVPPVSPVAPLGPDPESLVTLHSLCTCCLLGILVIPCTPL